jgi:hypothetical protein
MADADVDALPPSKLARAIATGDVDAVADVLDACEDDAATTAVVNEEAPGTWASPLHLAASFGEVEIIKLLLSKGADPNAEDIKGRTCLHVACDAYASDATGDLKWEDSIATLVAAGGALALTDVDGKLPTPGDDASTMVTSAVERAFEEGADARKAQSEKRRIKKKEKFDAIMNGKIQAHVSNASACAIAVMDTGDADGYKMGSRGQP